LIPAKLNGLIRQRRAGQWVLYSVPPNLSAFKNQIIVMSLEELKNSFPFKEDRERLENMINRPPISKEEG